MSHRKHLSPVAEGDESSDSGLTPILNEVQGNCGLSNAGPSSRRRRTRREGLVANGVASSILAVLDKTVKLNGCSVTIHQAADQTSTTCEPQADLVRAVENAIARQGLDLAQKRELFRIVAWRFVCVDCGRRQWADQYESSSFILWDGSGSRPDLRSGPCLDCKQEAREGKKCGEIVPYEV